MREYVLPLLRRHARLIAGAGFAVLLSTCVQIAGPLLVKYAIDEGLTKKQTGPLEKACLAYLVLALAKPLLQRWITLWSARAGERFLADLRTRTYERLQELSLPFFEGERAGVLVSRLTSDVQSLTTFVRMVLVEIVGNLLLFVVTLVVLVVLAPKLIPFALISLPILVFAWWRYRRLSKPAYTRIRDTVADTLAALQERFTGVRVIQGFRREESAFAGYQSSSEEQIRAWKAASYVNVGFWPLISAAQALSLAAVLVGGAMLYDSGQISIGTVAAFVLYLTSLFEPIARLAEWFTELRSGQAALAKIVGVLQTPVAVPEHDVPQVAAGRRRARRRERLLRLFGGAPGARGRRHDHPAGRAAGPRRPDRCGQVDVREAADAQVRPGRRRRRLRRHRPPRRGADVAARADRVRAAGRAPLLRDDRRERAARTA